MLDEQEQLVQSANGEPSEVSCQLVWNQGYVNEISKPFQTAREEGDGLVLLPDMKDGLLSINAIRQALDARGTAGLEISYEDGNTCFFTLPENDYSRLLELVVDDLYIPTFNDQIYTGKEVNPDLVLFMEEFIPRMTETFEEAKNSENISKVDELLQKIKSDEELERMYRSYLFIAEHVGFMRAVDTTYFEESRAEFEADIIKQDFRDYASLLGKVSDKALEFSDDIHRYFGDEAGETFDLTFKISGKLAEFVEKQVE